MRISVILPVHDVEPYVRRCLLSLFRLRIDPGYRVELIIVDDAGTDGSMAVVRDVLDGDRPPFPVRILRHSSNLGLSAARNTGLAHARGEFVWFVDSDDYVSADLLWQMLRRVTDGVDVVVANMVPVHPDGGTDRPMMRAERDTDWTGPQAVEAFLFQRIRAYMMNKLIRRDLFHGLEFPVGRLYEDVAVTAELLCRARTVAFTAAGTYFYRQRAQSITGRFDRRTLDLDHGVVDALSVIAGHHRAGRAGVLHFRYRAGVMSVADAAARAGRRTADTDAVLAHLRRRIRLWDSALAARHGLYVVAVGTALIKLAPGAYLSLYRLLRPVKRRRELRGGHAWKAAAAA